MEDADENSLKEGLEIIHRFTDQILKPLAAELEQKVPELKSQSLSEFIKTAAYFIRKALNQLMEMLEVSSLDNEGIGIPVSFNTISYLNGTLPLDFPYIVALVSVKDVPRLLPMFICRNQLEGIHDIISPNFVPFFAADSLQNAGRGIFTNKPGFFGSLAEFLNARKEDLNIQPEKNPQ